MTEPGLQVRLHTPNSRRINTFFFTPYNDMGCFFMFESIMLSLLAVFSAVGLVCTVYFLLLRLIKPDKNRKYYCISVFDENSENAACDISFVYSKLFSTGDMKYYRIIAVDNSMSVSQRQMLEAAFPDECRVKICRKEELMSLLFPDKENQSDFM